MKHTFKLFIIGVILAGLVFSTTAFATNQTMQKDVTYRNIKIVVDNTKVIPADANGNYVEPFIIDGTTYLPVRAVANAFGKDVAWDDVTNTVSLSNQSVVGTFVMNRILGNRERLRIEDGAIITLGATTLILHTPDGEE